MQPGAGGVAARGAGGPCRYIHGSLNADPAARVVPPGPTVRSESVSVSVSSQKSQVVVGAFLVQLTIIGCMFAYGVFFPALEAEFGWSRTFLSACSSLSFFVMGSGAILGGRLSDRFGPRGVLTATGLIFGVGYALLSQMTEPWQLLLLFGLFIGLGLSTHDVVTLSTIAGWFPNRRGTMSGLVKSGTAVGQVLIPLSASALIVVVGWRSAFLYIGLIALMVLLFAASRMRAAPAGSRHVIQ